MSVDKRSVVESDGALRHVLSYESSGEVTNIEIRHDPNDDSLMQVTAYNDDDVIYQNVFEMRDLSFDPISAIGRGETDKLTGMSSTGNGDDDTIPEEVALAFNSIGMAVVPQGRWWLDGGE